MDEREWLAQRFEQHRPRLRAVAYRMLGSLADADDALQDAWVRLNSTDAEQIENLGGWLTTAVGRVCLNMLRARRTHREDGIGVHLPDPIIIPDGDGGDLDPEQQALLADSVGLALLIVLDSLDPAERLAFVLHDLFDLPFDEIASMLSRSPAAARQLASRARRRVRDAEVPGPDADRARQRRVVDAFFAAARDGDFGALVRLLHPDVVLNADLGHSRPPTVIRGVDAVIKMARAPRGATVHPVLVNGTPGAVITLNGEPFAAMAFTIADGRIVEIDAIADPPRVRHIAGSVLNWSWDLP
jgi:RNA polymerase sigma-70 factor (ECF subfamily)